VQDQTVSFCQLSCANEQIFYRIMSGRAGVTVVRAGLVCHSHNSMHNTLAAPAVLLPRAARTT